MENELKPVKRAIVGFVEDKDFLIKQACVLYQSIKQLKSPNIDFILFGTGQALRRLPSDIIKIEIEPYCRKIGLRDYDYLNSVGIFKDECSKFLEGYDYILRTDLDTFILPKFIDYFPKLYTCGGGRYCNDQNTKDNLRKVALENSLRYRDQHNLGSTNYGNGKTICEVGRLTTDLTVKILNGYFSYSEGKWPGWYRGVSLLYGNELAVNHLLDTYQINKELLDYPSTKDDPISEHMHIHCWHTHDVFSKFDFTDGKYNNCSTQGLDLSRIKNYCLDTALKSQKYYK